MMVQQPVMMAPQPMMMMAPQPMQQQQPQIVINNKDDDGDCPQCRKGVMIQDKAWSCWTCVVCCCFWPGLCCDCAWGKKRKCLSCGYEVKL